MVVDLGCGPGNSTALLHGRWPGAKVIGVDNSPEMLSRARSRLPSCLFVESDIARWEPPESPDVVFANAVFHWIAERATLFDRVLGYVALRGNLAVQVPANHQAPSRLLLHELVSSPRWRKRVGQVMFDTWEPLDYVRLLQAADVDFDLWETTYLHVLEGDDPVLKWVRGAGLRPVMDRLKAGEVEEFLAEYGALLRQAYPKEHHGTTIFPFRRIFMVATRR